MIIEDELVVKLTPDELFDALNDADRLKAAIKQCKKANRIDADTIEASLSIKVGLMPVEVPVTLHFSERNHPDSCRLITKGGMMGMKFSSDTAVNVTPHDQGSQISYHTKVKVPIFAKSYLDNNAQDKMRKAVSKAFQKLSTA